MHCLSARSVVCALALAGLVGLTLGAAAVETRTESETLFWEHTPALPLASAFGATLALEDTAAGTAFAFVGAPGVGAAQLYELGLDETIWGTHTTLFPTTNQYLPLAIDGFPLYAALDAGGATTSIVRADTGQALVSGISGAGVESLVKSGSTLAFGQPDFFGGSGRVRIYEQNGAGTWVHAETFVGGFGDRLGEALAADGPVVVAGASNEGDNGAVHVYARTTSWIELQEILSPAAGQSDAGFGWAVALDGDLLAIGSPRLDRTTAPGALTNAEGVYVYEVVTLPFLLFELQALLRPPGVNDHDWFGSSVDLVEQSSGAVELAAGAPGDDSGANNSGAVYRYLRTGNPHASSWHPVTRMVNSQPVDLEQLGTTVALGQAGVLAGAPFGSFGAGATSGLVLFFDARIFADGFESGDLSAWDTVVP